MHRKCIHMHMRTTLNIDDELLAKAKKLSGLTEKTAIVHAGLAGIRAGAHTPTPTEGDLDLLDDPALQALGVERLAPSLADALDRLEASEAVSTWFPRELVEVFVAHKRGELAVVEGLPPDELRARYAGVY